MKIKTIVTDPALLEYGVPARASVGSAGLDLRAMFEAPSMILRPGAVVSVPTGMRIWIEDPIFVGMVFARSGLGTKGVVLGNGTGIIDADYQGPLTLSLLNRSQVPIQINRGDRVAQLVVVPVAAAELEVVESFEAETERGEGGFGSTGAA